MFTKHQTEVLVTGAGPVGLFTALRLSEHGVDVQIVDKHRRTGFHSYGLALHPATLRLFDEIGLAQELIAGGQRVDSVAFYEGTQRRVELPFSAVGGKYPFALAIPQSMIEGALETRLQKDRVKVQWNHRLQGFSAEAAQLNAEVARLDQVSCGYPISKLEWVVDKIIHTHCSYLVGADGYHSTVRERLDIEYRRLSDERIFSVFEFHAPTDLGNELRVVVHDGLINALWPLPDGRCRWSFQIRDPESYSATLEHLNALAAERAPWFPAAEGEIVWSSLVRFDTRLAESFGRDQVWLAGDSAHLASPVGVHSMNGGLAEARMLADHLAEILRRGGSTELLAHYDVARRQEWDSLLGTGALTTSGKADAWTRQHAATILSSVPASGDDLRSMLLPAGLELAPLAAS